MDYEKLLHTMCAKLDVDFDGYKDMDETGIADWPVEVREWWCSGHRQKLWRERRVARLQRRAVEAMAALDKALSEPA